MSRFLHAQNPRHVRVAGQLGVRIIEVHRDGREMMQTNTTERIVYHYTSQDGLIGILKSKTLWASHVLFQNDSYEFLHGKELFLEYIEQDFPKHFPNCPPNIVNKIDDWIKFYNNPIFTISFSEQRISLNQFRSYSKTQSGFSIGINIDRLIDGLDTKFQHKFVRCLYGEIEKRDFVKNVIRNTLAENHTTQEIDENLLAFIAARIVTYSPVLKHESFWEEGEWRLIFDYLSPIRSHYNFRAGKSFVIPYIEVPIKLEEVIYEVIIGPTPSPDLAIVSTRAMVDKFEIFGENPEKKVSNSGLPYRDW